MRMLLIHSEYLKYKPLKKALKYVKNIEKKEIKIDNVLVSFICAEKNDEKNIQEIVKKSVDEIKNKLSEVKAKNVVLYPYAHLSSDLAKPYTADRILIEMKKQLQEEKIPVNVSPFGYYKSFELKCLGHPLAEGFKEVSLEKKGKKPKKMLEKKEEEKTGKFHRFILMDVDGKSYEVTRKTWKNCPIFKKKDEIHRLLKIFVRNELEGNPPKGKPKHIEYMRKLELVDYCPESDVGHMKWYPSGILLFDLMIDYALQKIALPWGAFKMKNPMLFRKSIKEISQLMGEFHERDYRIEGDNEEFVLRFAADPGGFPFMQKVIFSHKQMPVKNYEEAICFRKEQSGECVGLMRLRNFHMTDMHCFCTDEKQAKEEYAKLCKMFKQLMNRVIAENNWVLGWEVVESYYDDWEDWFRKIVTDLKVPAFFKLMKKMTHYYAFKNEYQAIGADEANVQVSTVQYDVKDGERFDISYVGEDGKRHPCLILHASSFGSIERALYAMLEKAAKDELNDRAPMLPLWLSPEQIRLIPVSTEKHMDKVNEIAEKLEEANIRVGVDDRNLTVPKKVYEAKMKWIPRIVVVGDKELQSDKFPVVIREKSEVRKECREIMSLKDLIENIKNKCKNMPFRSMYLPREVSKRPIFMPWGK